MTRKQFIKEYIAPFVKENDTSYNRQLFNDAKDMLHKDKVITDRQVNNWLYPKVLCKNICKFE